MGNGASNTDGDCRRREWSDIRRVGAESPQSCGVCPDTLVWMKASKMEGRFEATTFCEQAFFFLQSQCGCDCMLPLFCVTLVDLCWLLCR